ncbi:MAG: reductive dehalogenase domain-containing protein [Anaerolineae bacterium]
MAAGALVAAGLFLLPVGRAEPAGAPGRRYDERDIMFARARLVPGSAEYDEYYSLRPEHKAADDRMRALPGLLSPDSREAHPHVFAATGATFDYIEGLRDRVDGPLAAERLAMDPEAATTWVKGLARYWGARAVGVAELRDYHVYSHVGRGTGAYGAPVDLDHRYAIAFTVEMAHAMVGTAPAAPTLLESARQYGAAAALALLLANTVRAMGYPARAHIDGNYRVIAPLVAWDAGLGEFGRLGLLMTPELGPRVRLGVVTTDLPLLPDGRRPDPSVLDFCTICEKCARNCPVRAIPFGPRQETGGALRWRIDQEVCYRYWCVTGTDCARCVAVCPYSHPDTAWHNVIRRAARRSGPARRAILRLDHLFYGARPQQGPSPVWLPPNPNPNRSRHPHA